MFFSEGQSCPVCQKPFQKEDDVVVCSVCGAPHHRACYQETGHCFYESTHGTPDQWKRESASEPPKAAKSATRRCAHCGFDNPSFAEFCGHCGRLVEPASNDEPDSAQSPNTSPFGGAPFQGGTFREFTFAPFRANVQNTGGIDPETEIGGEKAADVARVVARNESYYMPAFAKLEKSKKPVKWNWAAFLFGPFWLLFRKNYLVGGLTLLFSFMQQLLINYIEIVKLDLLSASGYSEMLERIQSCVSDPTLSRYMSIISIFTFVDFLLHLFFGFFGTAVYEHACLSKIRAAKAKFGESYRDMLPVVGGTSAGLALIAYCAWYFLPLILQSFMV